MNDLTGESPTRIDRSSTPAVGSGKARLSDWIALVKASGRLETLVTLEIWLRALKAYLTPAFVPLTQREREEIVRRDFATEAAIVRRIIEQTESDAAIALTVGEPPGSDRTSTEFSLGALGRLAGPTESLQNLLEVLNDLRVLINSVPAGQPFTYRHYLAVGRLYRHSLRNSRHITLLLHQRFKPQYDRVENAALRLILQGIEEGPRQRVALVFLHLYQILKHLQVVTAGLTADGPVRHYLAVFALVHEDSEDLRDVIRSKFAGGKALWPEPQQALEWIYDYLRSVVLFVAYEELVPVVHETSPAAVALRMSRAHDILRYAVQGCILSLARSFEPTVSPDDLFGPVPESAAATVRLHRELWDIRRMVRGFLSGGAVFQADRLIVLMSDFRESYLHRFTETDWQEFERFSGRLLQSRNQSDLRRLLAEFGDFLEALSEEGIHWADRASPTARSGIV